MLRDSMLPVAAATVGIWGSKELAGILFLCFVASGALCMAFEIKIICF